MKHLYFLIVLMLIGASPILSQESPMRFDVGIGFSMAVIDVDQPGMDSSYAKATGLMATLVSSRGGLNGNVRWNITPYVALGAETGIYYMSVDVKGVEVITFYDVPLRAIIRVGKGPTFLQAFGGYYFAIDSPFGGPEYGAKITLNGFNLSGAYVMGDYDFVRLEMGFSYGN